MGRPAEQVERSSGSGDDSEELEDPLDELACQYAETHEEPSKPKFRYCAFGFLAWLCINLFWVEVKWQNRRMHKNVTLEELMVSTLAMTDALAKLMIEKD